ncbi:nuclear transport factor 2 family protein [Sphingomonas sp. M1-B02]|uniref:nuclear transport factor 2 family protein n=1 Tax=Sphingomonas sp. M1-B02 TaxID=3114300 RepID=UPI00223ECE50|nr:nuclear transport factor 2 family protein [Sphingomonas sp. S6-11]UZK67074.1 nuclear transport factor 2 family protein [Sphingomonas sp. S6-11]
MRHLLFPLALLAPLPALAQTTPVTPIQKGTALPPPSSDEAAVLAPINALFASLERGDGAAIAQHVFPEGRVTAVGKATDGTPRIRQESWAQFSARLQPGKGFRERIWNPAIEIDDDIAMVWAPYDVQVDGKTSNCGIDHFDLVREAGRWKLLNITFSSRTTGCERP